MGIHNLRRPGMHFRRIGVALTFIGLSLGVASIAWSATPTKRGASPARAARPFHVEGNDQDRRIDINSINMWVTNFGSFAYDLATGNAGLVYPRGTAKTAVFASGLWLGCTVGPDVRIAVAEYSQEYGPGKMVGGTFDDPNRPQYKVYKVARFSGDPADTTHLTRSATYPDDDLVHHSWSEYIAGAAPYGAPLRTYRLPYQDVVAPADTDSVDVVGPDVLGDQMLWTVYNDADPSLHQNNAGQTAPLGVEVQQTTFGFNRQGALGNTVFVKFKIINAGANTLDNTFVSLWADPDLGGFTDDLVGCDTTLSLGFCYNATNNDQLYGSAPPAVGYDFFQGPKGPGGTPLPMTSFNKYINGTDPASTDETYNYMNGFLPDGSDVIDPTTGEATKFFHPGDPTTRTGWLDANPADRRLLLSSGPFSMAPGDTQVVVGAIVIGDGNDRLSSIDAMKFYDDFAQLAFDAGFQLPNPPPQPKVAVNVDHSTVTLSWDSAARNNYHEPGYTFEGYNIYQGESIAGPWHRLATFDEVNGVRTVRDTVFDLVTGRTINDYPVAFGTDAGVRFTYTTDQDAIRGGPLHDGTQYYYAVTAYAYSPTEKLAVLENAQVPVTVIPQRPATGTDVSTAGATVTQSRTDQSKPPATDQIEITVADPAQVTGDNYRIVFTPLFPPFPIVAGDSVKTAWNLVDVTTGDTLLFRQLNKVDDEDYQVVDGLKIRVLGAYKPTFQNAAYLNNVSANRRALGGVNFTLPFFEGGASAAVDFFGSTLDPATMPDSFTTVQVRFSHTATQKAYRFVRMQTVTGDPPAAPPDRGYLQRGFVDVPFQVWDATNNIQLDVAVLEKEVTDDAGNRIEGAAQLATSDSTWGPDAGTDGGREFIWPLRRPYSDTPKPE